MRTPWYVVKEFFLRFAGIGPSFEINFLFQISVSTQGGESLALGGSTSKLNSSEGNSSVFSSGSLSRQNSSEVLPTGKENSGDYNNVQVFSKKMKTSTLQFF